MEHLIILVHIIVAIAVVILILVQQGKGAEIGAAFGSGSANTLFGPVSGGNFFTRVTAILVTVFFITSISLAMIAHRKVTGGIEEGVPSEDIIKSASVQQPAKQEKEQGASDVPSPQPSAPAPVTDVPVVPAPASPAK